MTQAYLANGGYVNKTDTRMYCIAGKKTADCSPIGSGRWHCKFYDDKKLVTDHVVGRDTAESLIESWARNQTKFYIDNTARSS